MTDEQITTPQNPNPHLVLRPARLDDSPVISEVFLSARQKALPDLPKVQTDEEVRTWIRQVMVPRTKVWVAEIRGRVEGFFSLEGQTLAHLYVHPDHQGLNVGTALLDRARALSPERLTLYTFARNEGARRFYDRRGFRAIEFGHDNEENEPDVLYEWTSEAVKYESP
jgi:GNAT superfamily N-acetyltransferase